MPRQVAYDYLVAAAKAWPFVSEAAFRYCTLHLGRNGPALLDAPTAALANDLEHWLRPRAGGVSLETLRRIVEHTWFPPPHENTRSLAEVLVHIASNSLQIDGPSVVLKRDHELPQRLAHARWLSLLLPPDLLVAACGADEGIEPPDDSIHLCTPQLSRILQEQPVAETHLHLGAAVSFAVLWSAFLPGLGRDPPPPEQLRDAPLGGARTFLYLLTAAATTRLLLVAFLRRFDRNEAKDGFAADFESHLQSLAGGLAWPWGSADAQRSLRLALRAMVTGEIHPALPYPRLCALYRALLGDPSRPAQTLSELLEQDPISSWLAPASNKALPETRFQFRALSYMLGRGRDDTSFATLFWQYERIRGATYRYLVQEPGTPGLDWFSIHFERLWHFRRRLDAVRMEAAFELQSRGVNLGALEGRIGPETSWAKLKNEVRGTAAQAMRFAPSLQQAQPEVALVLHWIKEKEHGKGDARQPNADPRQRAHGVRFGAWGYKCLRTAIAMETALRACPELLLVVRGLDVASMELSVPTWPIVPLFARVREASKRAAAFLRRRYPEWQVMPLQATCHAGEDYGRLVEGLRRVHELIEFGVLGAGDRIGHGLCLGDDPERLVRCIGRSPQPAEERLDDLLWELDRYACGDLTVDSGRYAYASAEARRLGREIYGGPAVDTDALVEARRIRHDPRWLSRFGYPFRRAIEPEGEPERLLARYLRDEGVFRRGQVLVDVSATENEIVFLRAAQTFLRRQIAGLEITVESNPSSNLLIGDFLAVEEHPSFRIAPLPGKRTPDDCSLLLSINTDDPTTFASSLSDEFAHLYGALLRSSVSSSDALEWLAARRDQGYRSRFTHAASAELDALRMVAGPLYGASSTSRQP